MGEFNSSKDLLNLASHILDARIAMARGRKDEAVSHWQKAVEMQDALRYDEPPDWYYPVRESLGAALLAAGKPTDAEQVFRQDLERNPRNPRSLFGLMHTLKAQKKDADAAWVESNSKLPGKMPTPLWPSAVCNFRRSTRAATPGERRVLQGGCFPCPSSRMEWRWLRSLSPRR